MHSPEALILRRCFPVPVTFKDLRAASEQPNAPYWGGPASRQDPRVCRWWTAALKEATGALDEVYAVVDGREVRVAIVDNMPCGVSTLFPNGGMRELSGPPAAVQAERRSEALWPAGRLICRFLFF